MKNKLFAIFLLLVSLNVFAQNNKITDTSILKLNEVVVTAQRHQQINLVTASSVKTISKKDFEEYQYRTTPEALMSMNGVFVQKTNHGGGSPFLRGLTGNQTLILVDGIRLNNSTFRYGPNQYLNTIDAYTINKIEVAMGTGSVQYGTDAIGGAINLITTTPQFSADKNILKAKSTAKYMTGDMEKTIRAEVEYNRKKVAFNTGFTRRNFGDLIGGKNTGKQAPSGYNELAFDFKTNFLLSENTQLIIANQILQQSHVPVYHKVILENFSLNEMDLQQRLLSYVKLNKQSKSPLFKETEIILSFQQNIEGRKNIKNASSVLRFEKDKINTIGITGDVFSEFTKNWNANTGIEIYADKVFSNRNDVNTITNVSVDKRGLYPNNSSYKNYSIYSLHHYNIKNWIVDAGLRFNSFNINISDTSLGAVKISPSALVGNLALLYKITKGQSAYVSYGSGFRAPNIDDMGTLGIVDFRYEIPTTNLKPEKSQNTEIGYKFQSKKMNATFAAYYIHLSNIITRVKEDGKIINGYQVYKKENTESAYVKGFEANVNLKVFHHFYIYSGISYTYGVSLSKAEPLRRIPPFNGRISSTYKKSKWFITTEYIFASKQNRLAQGDKDDNRIGPNGTAGWNVINFYSGYTFPFLNCNVGVQNILNKDYRTHGSGINGVGRSAWLAITIKI